MALISYDRTGVGRPVVMVHGFACARSDWNAQVASLAPRHDVIAVDLRMHGATPGVAADCTIERFGADVAELLQTLDLRDVALIGHSMGCRVVVEAALQTPLRVAGLVLIDGSRFAAAARPLFEQALAGPGGVSAVVGAMFAQMFNARSDKAAASAIIERASRLATDCARQLLLDMVRYDVTRFEHSLAALAVPVLALQTTTTNERRERRSIEPGTTTPYIDMLCRAVPEVRIEILPGIAHFPQIDAPDATNALIAKFIDGLADTNQAG